MFMSLSFNFLYHNFDFLSHNFGVVSHNYDFFLNIIIWASIVNQFLPVKEKNTPCGKS